MSPLVSAKWGAAAQLIQIKVKWLQVSLLLFNLNLFRFRAWASVCGQMWWGWCSDAQHNWPRNPPWMSCERWWRGHTSQHQHSSCWNCLQVSNGIKCSMLIKSSCFSQTMNDSGIFDDGQLSRESSVVRSEASKPETIPPFPGQKRRTSKSCR